MSMVRHVVLSIGFLGLVGCASVPERDMRAALAAQVHEPVTLGTSPPTETRQLPELDEAAALTAYLRYAALNNPELEAAFYRWQAALEKVPQARTLPDPQLTYVRFIEEVETRVGAQENRVGIAQTFPWFGKLRTRGDQALATAEAARWRYEQAKLALFFRVVDAYAEYYYLGRATVITEENLALMEHFESVARRRYEVAKAQYSDVVKAQVELGKLSDRVRTLRAMRPAVAAALNAALNRPIGTPIPWPQAMAEPRAHYDPAEVRPLLHEQNPELQALGSEIEAAQRAVELARLRYYPDVTLGLDWIGTDRALMPTPESGKDAVLARVSFNLPLWYESYRAAEREARAKLQSATRKQEERANTLGSSLERAIFRYDDSRRKINLFRDTLVPKAQQSLEATETAFTTDVGDFLDLIDAERILLEFQLSFERALTDATQRDAEVQMLLGAAQFIPASGQSPAAERPTRAESADGPPVPHTQSPHP